MKLIFLCGKHFFRSAKIPRDQIIGSEKAASEFSRESHAGRFSTLALIDEFTDCATAYQASSIKLKQLITTNGELNSIFKSRRISTPNNLIIVSMSKKNIWLFIHQNENALSFGEIDEDIQATQNRFWRIVFKNFRGATYLGRTVDGNTPNFLPRASYLEYSGNVC